MPTLAIKGGYCSAVVLVALFAVTVGAKQSQARDLIEIAGPHFTVVSALTEKDTRALIDDMRVFQTVVTSFTTVRDLRPQVPLHIYLVGAYDWDKYFRPSKYTAGFMSPGRYSFVGAMDAQSWGDASRILFHEYVHFVMRNGDSNKYPQWLDEGLAEVLSTVRISPGKVIIGESPHERLVDLAVSGGGRWVPLKQVLTAMPRTDDDSGATHGDTLGFYAVSWALVHYISFELPEGNKALAKYLTLQEGGASIDDAFATAFGMSIADMEVVLKRYVQRDAFKIVTADRKKLPLPPAVAYQVRQLNEVDSALTIGQALMRTGMNKDRVPAYYDRILKLAATNPLALAGKANALALIGEFAAADPLIKQALELAPANAEVLIMAGDIESLRGARKGEKGEPVTMELRAQQRRKMFDYYTKALGAPYSGPDFLEVVASYADLSLEYQTNFDMALLQVQHARTTYSTEPHIAAKHAQLLMATQRPREARAAWEMAARYGTGHLRESAIRAIKSIDASR